MKSILIISSLLFASLCVQSQKVFDFNSTCIQSYQEITKLKIKSGKQLAERAKQQNQDNLIPLLLESDADFYMLILNENPSDYKLLYPIFQIRLDQLQEGPKSSPFYLYSQAILRIQRRVCIIKGKQKTISKFCPK